jgi:hypothetical protein
MISRRIHAHGLCIPPSREAHIGVINFPVHWESILPWSVHFDRHVQCFHSFNLLQEKEQAIPPLKCTCNSRFWSTSLCKEATYATEHVYVILKFAPNYVALKIWNWGKALLFGVANTMWRSCRSRAYFVTHLSIELSFFSPKSEILNFLDWRENPKSRLPWIEPLKSKMVSLYECWRWRVS